MNIAARIRLIGFALWGPTLKAEGETTSPEVASIAAKGLAKPMSLTSREIRMVCASALTQAPNRGKA